MKNELIKYMSERFRRDLELNKNPGPVITISRLYGCPAKKVAELLAESLTEKAKTLGGKKPWKWVSKEILTESAKELNVDPEKIQYVFDYEQKSVIDEILSATSYKYYKSDRKIRNTIGKVIRNISMDGHAIIVGRGGVAIAKDIPRSLHVNLEAPLEWRAIRAAEKHCITIDKARRYANDIDKKRQKFREFFEGKNTDYTWFDMTINCMSFKVEEIVDIILKVAETRGLVA